MHAVPRALARPRRRPAASSATAPAVERILLRQRHDGRVRGVRLEDGDDRARRRRGRNARPARPCTGRWCPGSSRPARVRRGALLAVGGRLARRRAGAPAAGRRPPQHPLRPRRGAESFDALSRRACRMPDPSHPRHRADRSSDPAWRRRARRCSTSSSRSRTSTAGSTGPPSASRPWPACVAAVARLGYPSDSRVGGWSTRSTGRRCGLERGTPFSLSHTFWQSGPFRPSNVERRAPGLVLRRLGHRARRRRADGAHLGTPGCRAGRAGASRERPPELRQVLPALPADQPAPRHDVLLVDAAAPPRQAAARLRALRVLPARRRHRRRPRRRRPPAATGPAALHRLRRPVLRRPRAAGDPTTTSSQATVHTVRALGRSIRLLRALPAVDGDGPHDRPLRHLGRPLRLHGRLGRRDRRDDAADPRAARRRRRSSRPADSGWPSSSRTSCATSTRTSTAGGSTCPQEDLDRFGADPWRAGGHARVAWS